MSSRISPQVQNEDENQAIDRMFAFVKHEYMETPKSSIITHHRSMSTPRQPLATSTPIVPTVSKTPLITKSIQPSGNSSVLLSRRTGAGGDAGTANSRNTSTTTSTMALEAPKMDDSIAKAINEQQMFQSKCRSILSEIAHQQDQMVQAYDIISLCQKKLVFSGTFQEMNAQRTLLVANERRLALHRQLEKLKKSYQSGNQSSMQISVSSDVTQMMNISAISMSDKFQETQMSVCPTVALQITSIKVLLNRSFYIKTVDEDISFAFVIICKTEEQMYATQLMNVLDMGTLRVSTVQFRESIRFQNLSPNFTVVVEIYALKIAKRSSVSRYTCASKIANRAKALIAGTQNKRTATGAPTSQPTCPTTEFRRCGLLYINAKSKNKQQFLLEEVEYPLEGTVEMRCDYF